MVLCHGLMCHKNSSFLPLLSRSLAATHGTCVLRFDFASSGCDESESEGEFSCSAYDDDVSDLSAAVSFLREQRQLTVPVLIGHSKGAGVVLLYGARHPGIPFLIEIRSACTKNLSHVGS
jgi:pimeloyl-ACP methyl ester carboxylesterase